MIVNQEHDNRISVQNSKIGHLSNLLDNQKTIYDELMVDFNALQKEVSESRVLRFEMELKRTEFENEEIKIKSQLHDSEARQLSLMALIEEQKNTVFKTANENVQFKLAKQQDEHRIKELEYEINEKEKIIELLITNPLDCDKNSGSYIDLILRNNMVIKLFEEKNNELRSNKLYKSKQKNILIISNFLYIIVKNNQFEENEPPPKNPISLLEHTSILELTSPSTLKDPVIEQNRTVTDSIKEPTEFKGSSMQLGPISSRIQRMIFPVRKQPLLIPQSALLNRSQDHQNQSLLLALQPI